MKLRVAIINGLLLGIFKISSVHISQIVNTWVKMLASNTSTSSKSPGRLRKPPMFHRLFQTFHRASLQFRTTSYHIGWLFKKTPYEKFLTKWSHYFVVMGMGWVSLWPEDHQGIELLRSGAIQWLDHGRQRVHQIEGTPTIAWINIVLMQPMYPLCQIVITFRPSK